MSDNNATAIPRVSRIRVTVLASVIIVIMAVVAWNARTFFRLNHVDFLLNQRQFDEGMALLNKAGNAKSENTREALLRVKALTLLGDYDAAMATANNIPRVNDASSNEALYWKSLAQFQAGQTTASKHSAQRFLSTGKQLPNGTIAIAGALAETDSLTDIPKPESAPFRMMFPVEQATYLACAASQQMELGHFDLASRVYENAFILGNRNTQSLQNAALVSILIGDDNAARMYLDYAGLTSLENLQGELERRYRQTGQTKLTLQGEDASPGRRRIDVARAIAWVKRELTRQNTISLEQSQQSFARLLQDYSSDPVLRLYQADALLEKGQTKDALEIYMALQQSDPTVATQLRIAKIAAGESNQAIAVALQPLLNKLNSATVILPAKSDDKPPADSPNSIISADHPAAITVNVKTRGTYLVSIIARAKSHTGRWPLLSMKSTDETLGVSYVSSESWAIYSTKVLLDVGNQPLEFALFEDNNTQNDNHSHVQVEWALVLLTGSSTPE